MIHEANEQTLREALEELFLPEILANCGELGQGSIEMANCRINGECFRTIIVQLRALGLIVESTRQRSVKDTATYWTLTPYGDNVMNRLRAISRMDTDENT